MNVCLTIIGDVFFTNGFMWLCKGSLLHSGCSLIFRYLSVIRVTLSIRCLLYFNHCNLTHISVSVM